MIRMMHGEKTESLADLGFLLGCQSILFGKLRGAFRCRTGFSGGGVTLWRLEQISKVSKLDYT
jgi:hypothetical protein